MYQIGLKLWSINTDIYLQEAEKLFADGVFSYIELFVVPGSLEHLPAWKKLKCPFIIHNAHFMQHFNLAKREKEADNRKIYEETRRFADELDAKYIIFHGGIEGSIEETARQLASFHEPRAVIENKPFRALPNRMGGEFCRGYNIAELKTVMDAAGCGFCLDFGHAICAANSQHVDPYEYIREMKEALSPSMFHLTDIDDTTSEWDSHPHLGTGQLNLGKICSMLPEDAIVTAETNKNSKTDLQDFIPDAQTLRFYDLSCRRAEPKDAKAVFEISNDPEVRAASFQTSRIEWEGHLNWFESKLQDSDCHFYVFENGAGQIAAQVRFQKTEQDRFEVSFSIDGAYRGKHCSVRILSMGISRFRKDFGGHCVLIASIKHENIASQKCFGYVGFQPLSSDDDHMELSYEL